MSAPVQRDLASRVPARPVDGAGTPSRVAVPGRGAISRLARRIDRSMWPADRALAELRWAGLALGLILVMALAAAIATQPFGAYGQAAAASAAGLLVVAGLGWNPRSRRIAALPWVRHATGPFVVLVAMAAAGPHDPLTLAPPEGRPFIILAITYAALTPGFGIAAGLVALASAGLLLDHAVVRGHPPLDDHAVEFAVRVAVTFMGAVAIHAIDRGLRRERARAETLTARRLVQADRLEDLQRILRRFDGSRSVAAVMQSVVEDVATTFDVTLVAAFLPDPRGRLTMVAAAGYDGPPHVVEPGVGIVGRCAATKETIVLADVLADPGYRAARPDVRSEVAVPILHGEDVLGVLNFEGTMARPIMSPHVAVAEMLARSIAGALRSAVLDEERRHRLHAIERVLEVSRALASDLDRPRVVAAVVDAARDLLAADQVEFASADTSGGVRVELAVGSDAHERLGAAVESGAGLAGEVLQAADRVVWSGTDGRPVGLGFPIQLGGVPGAVLAVTRDQAAGPFTELELRIADLLATQIEAALHNAELHARVSEAAVRDPLTGLLNRRYFDEAAETAFAVAARTGDPLSLVVLDLDRFSEVNNVHGHAIGDAVLRRVARAMTGVIRQADVVARYGGEEFVVIAPGTDTVGAVRLAERIRTAVAEAGAVPIDGLDIPITISAGVATRLGDEADGRALFRAADSALLAAKRAGRDRVVSL